MVDQKFLDELDHVFRHAKAICEIMSCQKDFDWIGIVKEDDSSESLKVEYTYSRGYGYGYGDYSGEFPIKYLTMTLDEIRDEQARIAKEEELKELARKTARKPKEIENIALNIKISQNSAEAFKQKYKAVTGEDWKE